MNKTKTILVHRLECRVCGMPIIRCVYCSKKFRRNQTIYCSQDILDIKQQLNHYCENCWDKIITGEK